MPLICAVCHEPTRQTYWGTGQGLCYYCNRNANETNPATAIARDEIPGGVVCHNYGREPIRFYSHSERRRYMAAHGLQERETFAPMPGTDIDPQGIPNPKGFMDPKTLENARVLVSRPGAKLVAEDETGTAPIESREMSQEESAIWRVLLE